MASMLKRKFHRGNIMRTSKSLSCRLARSVRASLTNISPWTHIVLKFRCTTLNPKRRYCTRNGLGMVLPMKRNLCACRNNQSRQSRYNQKPNEGSKMAISNCPMCESPVPPDGGETAKTCSSCGADLTRWMPKPVQPATLEVLGAEPEAVEKSNLVPGIMGALIGAGLGAGIMYAFYEWAGFRFPLLGVGIGVLTGF